MRRLSTRRDPFSPRPARALRRAPLGALALCLALPLALAGCETPTWRDVGRMALGSWCTSQHGCGQRSASVGPPRANPPPADVLRSD